ncbi:unnamed protein product [Dimorphilus gyrociliatus]|uniref:RBR-type E3 ubiquitin transferase n=1 Tax=Dimorphilus gyrociliatus TaxID=2664684 RepID=A0A7I8W436_9ANNE|nr:unnamed protein product [Dimorphilus gyrociliatus]
MEFDEPVTVKNSVLYPNRLYYKDFRTGNRINYKILRKFQNLSDHFVQKEFLYDESLNLKEAKQLFDNRIRELDDGGLEADPENYYIPFLYSTNKRGRWQIQEDINAVGKAKWLKGEDYSISYNERHMGNLTRPNVKLRCNRDGIVKKSKTLSRQRDLMDTNKPELDEECPVSIQYSFFAPGVITSNSKSGCSNELTDKVTLTRMRKRRNCFIERENLSTDSIRHIFSPPDEIDCKNLTDDKDTASPSNYSLTLNDFIVDQQKNERIKKGKRCKKGRKLSWKSLEKSRLKEEEKEEIEELETFLESNLNKDSREEITFKFILPAKCYKSFLIDCSEENIYVLDAETNSQMFLLDFTYKIRNTFLEYGMDENAVKMFRFLALTTFLCDNDNIIMKMVLYTNINCNSTLASFENFSESFSSAINEVNYHIFSWLQSYLPLREFYEKTESKNKQKGEKELLKLVHESVFGNQMSTNYEDVWLGSLKNYWEENRPKLEDLDITLLEVDDWNIQCDICMEQYDTSEGLSLKCKHWFCIHCWKEHLSIFNFNCPTCPMVNCKVQASLPVYLAILNFDRFITMEKRIIEKTIKNEAWVYCKKPKCQKLTKMQGIQSSTVFCSCSEKWCKLCGLDEHWPSSCNQYQYFLQFQQKIKNPRNANFDELILIVSVRKCPFCGVLIEKFDGCNEMLCLCKNSFCWKCLSPWRQCVKGCKQKEKESQDIIFTNEKCIKTLQYRQAIREEKMYPKLKMIYSQVEKYTRQMNIPLNDFTEENVTETLVNSTFLCKLTSSLLKNCAIYTGTLIREDLPSEILRKLSNLQELLNRAETFEMKLHNLIELNNRMVFRKSRLENVIKTRESLDKLVKEIVFSSRELQGKMQIYKQDTAVI